MCAVYIPRGRNPVTGTSSRLVWLGMYMTGVVSPGGGMFCSPSSLGFMNAHERLSRDHS